MNSIPKRTLFICQSCHHSSEERSKDQPADGARLLEQLNRLLTKPFHDVEIQPVGCLWTCDKPCIAAFSALNKPTYLFPTLPTHENAPALLAFGKFYCSSDTGDIPYLVGGVSTVTHHLIYQ